MSDDKTKPVSMMEALRNAVKPEERLDDEIPLDDAVDVEAAPVPDDGDLRKVRTLALRLVSLGKEIVELNRQLAQKSDEYKVVRETDLPMALVEMGMEEFKLTGGGKVVLKSMTTAAITEANRPAAHEWLERDGSGDIIKRTIIITFGKGDEAWAKKFLQDLNKRKKPVQYEVKEAVNFQTLGKFIRDRLASLRREGKNVEKLLPHELFGIFTFRVADYTPPEPK